MVLKEEESPGQELIHVADSNARNVTKKVMLKERLSLIGGSTGCSLKAYHWWELTQVSYLS